ncbi:MAG: two-component system sensor histidine kinase TtrS [Sulfurimonas sp.]|jgi:two-component system sensor histidine kinase TtrS|uniref:HD domain-containing phosphohydrolase n=1 Tax=Sulfurimonas sp. TaxID=2022749 RepID=UPI0039E54ABF
MHDLEYLEKEIKQLRRKNKLLEQTLKQDHAIHKKYTESLVLLEEKDRELIDLNIHLEDKVAERTVELEDMYQHEQHFKEMMKMVADVNEFLVGAMNMKSIVRTSIDNVCKQEHFNFCWFGLINKENNFLEVIHKSEDIHNLIDCTECLLDMQNPKGVFQSAIEAIKSKKSVLQQDLSTVFPVMKGRRSYDYQLEASVSIPLFHEDKVFAVISIYSSQESIDDEEISILENLGKDIAFAISINQHRNILEKLEIEKITNYEETILAFVDIIEQRDAYTAGHTVRVAEYCRLMAAALNIPNEKIQQLERAAILHDIGKVVTPDAILLKPGKLSNIEYDLIKQHATAGYKMLSNIAMYQDLADIIRHHHEHYDGTGYPDALKGDDISFLTHIMIVADAFDAMTTNRVYKGRKTVEEAVEELVNLSGIHFHPNVIEVAQTVLLDVDINDTDQMPHSDLEQKRFSYFFQDALTSVHNESYLEMVLNKDTYEYSCLNLLLLRNFTQYNHSFGWDKGNEMLVQIAKGLQKHYPNAEIFRFHGDDFILLHQENTLIDMLELNTKLGFSDDIYFELHHFDTNDFSSAKAMIEELKR